MIAFLQGKIHKLSPFELIINVQGTGYRVYITLSDSEILGKLSHEETILIYTRVQYNENTRRIFGFLDEGVAAIYDFLIDLHGIGPKIVMSILSYCSTIEFINALENSNSAFLTKIPGIGRSKAEKIIFEAKSRQKKLDVIKTGLSQVNSDISQKQKFNNLDYFTDILMQSLENLGFSDKEIKLAEKKITMHEKETPAKDADNIQKWVRLYLKYL